MNIKNRLEKVESKVTPKSQFCECRENQNLVRVYDADEASVAMTATAQTVCDKCQKAINQSIINIVGVKPIFQHTEV